MSIINGKFYKRTFTKRTCRSKVVMAYLTLFLFLFISSSFSVNASLDLYPHHNQHLQDSGGLGHPSTKKSMFLVPKRFMYAVNHIERATIATPSSNTTQDPSPSSLHKHKREKAKKWTLVFLGGSVVGFIGAMCLTVVYKVLSIVIRGEAKDSGCVVFSQSIKVTDLDFLQEEDMTSLQVIGRGGCGQVYKAELPGKVLAIKQIVEQPMDTVALTEKHTKALNRQMRQIKAEVHIVGQIRHRNLLPLWAHVSRPGCHFLIYELMKNGSLEDMLRRDYQGTSGEDWLARHKIATGIAVGLEYLHTQHSPRIIHRDLKPANILLDDDMEAKITDFGLSKVMPDFQTHVTSTNVAGTLGYIAPEYYQTMKFTTKCDIYSYGVLLMVLVTGKFPSDEFFREHQIGLLKWVRDVMVSEDPNQAIDPRLVGNGYEEQMLLVLRMACYCTCDNPKDRPDSKDVVCMLAQIEH